MSLLPIGDLNRATADEFAAALRVLFEAAPPLSRALYAERPFASYTALIDRAEGLAAGAPEDDQIAIVNAHPRIGAPPSALSALSRREQSGGGSGSADSPAVQAALDRLNAEYERRFGFRFVVFVNRRPKAAILEVLRDRLERSRTQELQTGLEAMFAIARDRLRSLAGDAR